MFVIISISERLFADFFDFYSVPQSCETWLAIKIKRFIGFKWSNVFFSLLRRLFEYSLYDKYSKHDRQILADGWAQPHHPFLKVLIFFEIPRRVVLSFSREAEWMHISKLFRWLFDFCSVSFFPQSCQTWLVIKIKRFIGFKWSNAFSVY